ncbi:MAG: hypothetical protein WD491_09915, partial [Balneolales bacterium]
LFEFYLKSSTHVSLAVTAFSGITMLHLDIKSNPCLLLFIFLGTITGYNFIKYAAIARLQHFSLSNSLRMIQVYSLICFVGLVWVAFKLSAPVLFTAAALGLLNLLYAFPFYNGQFNLRNITGAKIFVIALVWTGVTVWLPVLDGEISFSLDIGIASIQRLMFVIVLTLPFDIRDIHFDTEQLGTVPQLMGVEKTRNIALLLLGLILFLDILRPSTDWHEFGVLLIATVVTAWLVRKSVIQQNKYYATFWVEGVPVLWWILLMAVTV